MIHRLEIENFYSIANSQVIDLCAAENVPEQPDRLVYPCKGDKERYPAVVAIFGPNAAGKTNVLRAISFIRWWVVSSFQAQPREQLPLFPFYSECGRLEPTRIAIEFAGREDPLDDSEFPSLCPYRYEIQINTSKNAVLRESLHYWPGKPRRKRRMFERYESGEVKGSNVFPLRGFSGALTNILRPNASLVATLAQLQHPISLKLWDAAQWIYSNVFIDRIQDNLDVATNFYAQNKSYFETLNAEVRRFDLGIRNVELKESQGRPIALFTHEGLDTKMPLRFESSGTQRFFNIFPALKQTLEVGGIAVIDELDADIHPMILPEIVGWFHDPDRNPNRGQLWFSCHNPSILDSLIKEEVFFTEKDHGGRTSVYGLTDIKGVRRVDNFYKQYLGGVYGAVPSIG
ncbi:MAG TPA: abortive infection protein [Rhodobiaceae bacterium]|nr:abortive infection protein [Rhodobiaceae bacterium]|tara:strand:+ start:421 stop:1626 length:1206 start_codon:yes stop_codon:yes gene_type:complete